MSTADNQVSAPSATSGVRGGGHVRADARKRAVLPFLEAYGLLILLVLCAVFFSVWSRTADTFLTTANLKILFANQAIPAIIALGALVPLVCYKIDLSVGPVAGLSAVFVASWLSGGMAIPLAVLLGVGLGVLVGAVNALLVARMGVNDVIATLGVGTILHGVVVQKTGGLAVVSDIPVSLTDFGSGDVRGIPNVALLLVVVAVGVHYVLAHTPLGRELYAYGSNQAAAQLVGIRTKYVVGLTFFVAAMLCAAAGVLYVARAGGAAPNIGDGFTLPAIAAAFLSAAAIKPGRYNVGGTLVAIFFLAVLNNGLTLAGAEPYVASYVNGAALVVGVSLAAVLYRRRAG